MAINKGNSLLYRMSGKFNQILFQKNGVMRSLPDLSKRKWSPLQVKHLNRMEQGKNYARQAMADPEQNAYYSSLLKKWKKKIKGGNIGVYQLAICDFFHPPVIRQVELLRASDPLTYNISIHVCDNFKVEGVFVSILSPDGTMIEQGDAQQPETNIQYIYLIQHT
ncbi:MAG: hypothetical protein WCI71_15935, partial [Bacteroidota bacterium]